MVDLEHLGCRDDGIPEALDIVVAVGAEADRDEAQEVEARLLAVDQGDVAVDDAVALQPPDATVGRRLREADATGQVGVGQAAIRLELAQDRVVDLVTCGVYHGRRP